MGADTEIRLRVWVEKKDQPYLGPGRIRLLEEVAKHGSISKAAASLNMSYRKAWQLINNMNALANQELVSRITGGKNGGGASVTPAGQKAIALYRSLQQEVDDLLSRRASKITF